MGKRVIIIGSGLGGLGAACLLSKAGYEITVLEKNDQLGGRAGQLKAHGFTFDTGPSWYLMPEVFERFFGLLDEKVADHLKLVRLSPSYRVFYGSHGSRLDITGDLARDKATLATIEPGTDMRLDTYLRTAARIHDIATSKLLYKTYDTIGNMLTRDLLREARHMRLLASLHTHVARHFKDPILQHIMEFPAVFLGSSPYNTPALYSLLSHVLFNQGVFYPMGGIYKLIEALQRIGQKHGVRYETNAAVERIIVKNSKATGVIVDGHELHAGVVISNADLHHTETQLLAPQSRDHSERYWRTRTLAPSALLMYLGVNRTYGTLQHHNLLFSDKWRQNFTELFKQPVNFPTNPSLYVCAPGKTDPTVAPAGYENLFVLVPIAAGIDYTATELEAFADTVLATIEHGMQLPGLREHIVYKKLFCAKDFTEQFNSFKGTGLGLAHTLTQTAIFRPRIQSHKVPNLLYVGANVHPGIGMPMTLISAELAYKRLSGDRSGALL